jgi:cystathionine gamma-synthase
MKINNLDIKTNMVHGRRLLTEVTGAISMPIYQSATFRHPAYGESTGYDYSRVQNPTREEVEHTIALLEGGSRGFAFSTGMAAIAAMMELLSPGDHIIVSDDLYGGTYRLFEEINKKNGIKITYVDTSDIEAISEKISKDTKALFIETPTNPMMKVADIRGISSIAKENDLKLIVDNTFLTPYFQRPLDLGADMVVHSGTKYLGGHNDTLAGFLVTNNDDDAERIDTIHKTIGAVLSPFDSWLILRGIKTLGIRMERQQSNAMKIAQWLKSNQHVEEVYYVGLEDHPGHEINNNQSEGSGAMISFRVKDVKKARDILGRLKIISFAESLGGVESLITYPIEQTHQAIPKEIRDRIGVDEYLLRLSVGIEEVKDLIADLDQGINRE